MKDAAALETLIEKYGLILTNKPKQALKPTWWSRTPIIDHTFTTPDVGKLDT